MLSHDLRRDKPNDESNTSWDYDEIVQVSDPGNKARDQINWRQGVSSDPVHVDVHDIKVIFVEEPDSKVNPMGIKAWARLELSELRPPSPTPSIMRLENACATCR